MTYKETLLGTKIDPAVDPVTGLPIWTGTWRDTRFSPPNADGGRPENALIGQIWTVNCCSHSIQVPVAMKNLRLWQNTRVAELTSGFATLGSETLGYEWGEALENGFQPAGLVRMSSTTATDQQIIQTFGANVAQRNGDPQSHALPSQQRRAGVRRRHRAVVVGSRCLSTIVAAPCAHPRSGDAAGDRDAVRRHGRAAGQPAAGRRAATPVRWSPSQQSTDIFAPTSTISSPAQGGTVESGERIAINGTATDPNGGVVAGVEVSVNNGVTWNKAQGTTAWTFEWSAGAIGQTTIRTRAIDDRGNLEIAGTGHTVTIANGACPCPHLFKPSALPANPNFPDNGAYELGVKFRSDIAGFITGIRYYKSVDNSGTHLGNLWSATGTLMATATFVNESASGWQEVLFASPVAIAAEHHLRRVVSHQRRPLRDLARLFHRCGRQFAAAARARPAAKSAATACSPAARAPSRPPSFNARELLGRRRVLADQHGPDRAGHHQLQGRHDRQLEGRGPVDDERGLDVAGRIFHRLGVPAGDHAQRLERDVQDRTLPDR